MNIIVTKIRTLTQKILCTPLGFAAAAIRSFLLSVSPPFGVKNFAKIRVDRTIVPLNISIKMIIFHQIRVNRDFFSKRKFFQYLERGWWGRIFLGTFNDVSWKF